MDKRYQIFISSTFADLQDERGKVQQAIMEMDCIPAGMELFPALDEDQFEFIKKVIDDCDYYLLIIGGRYGSLSSEGVSYTEMEYRYAIEKGIKVIAFLHKDPESLPASKSEKDNKARKKLSAFRGEVSTGRLVKFWTEANELPGLTLSSLTRTIKMHPATGWVRGDSTNDTKLYKELNDLRKENQELKAAAQLAQSMTTAVVSNLAELDEEITVHGTAQYRGDNYRIITSNWESVISWKQIFMVIAPKLLTSQKDNKVKELLKVHIFAKSELRKKIGNGEVEFTSINQHDFDTIKIQMRALGLVNLKDFASELLWELTEYGDRELVKLRVVLKSNVDL